MSDVILAVSKLAELIAADAATPLGERVKSFVRACAGETITASAKAIRRGSAFCEYVAQGFSVKDIAGFCANVRTSTIDACIRSFEVYAYATRNGIAWPDEIDSSYLLRLRSIKNRDECTLDYFRAALNDAAIGTATKGGYANWVKKYFPKAETVDTLDDITAEMEALIIRARAVKGATEAITSLVIAENTRTTVATETVTPVTPVTPVAPVATVQA